MKIKINIVPEIRFEKEFFYNFMAYEHVGFHHQYTSQSVNESFWFSTKCMSLQSKDRGHDFANIHFPCDFARGKKIPQVKKLLAIEKIVTDYES